MLYEINDRLVLLYIISSTGLLSIPAPPGCSGFAHIVSLYHSDLRMLRSKDIKELCASISILKNCMEFNFIIIRTCKHCFRIFSTPFFTSSDSGECSSRFTPRIFETLAVKNRGC